MGYMYYVNLGNLGQCKPNNASPDSCASQVGDGLAHTGPFQNLDSSAYWPGTTFPSEPDDEWFFKFYNGGQSVKHQVKRGKGQGLYLAWAVRSGDVAAPVPLPGTLLMMGTGLVGLLSAGRRQPQLS